MAKANVLNLLYTEKRSPLEFKFDMLTAPPLLSLLTYQDIYELNRIARSVKLVGKIDEKYKMIDNIMNHRGFVKLHAGTNRVVYRFIEDQRFVIKVAVDRVGLGDNPAEFQNQFLLKPFVTRVFEVSGCGTVALVERVDAIMSREEFLSVADDVFSLITKFFVGKYVLEDIGAWFFMNWGIRKGFGPVLLDFPYVYELDGNKLYCNAPINPYQRHIKCGGQLDYDDGFNNLICTKCKKQYNARDLKKAEKDQLIIVGGKKTMKVKVKVGSEVILDSSKQKVAKVIDPEPVYKERSTMVVQKPKAAIFNKIEPVIPKQEETKVEEPKVEVVETFDSEPNEVIKQEEFPLDSIAETEVEENSDPLEEIKAWTDPNTGILASLEECGFMPEEEETKDSEHGVVYDESISDVYKREEEEMIAKYNRDMERMNEELKAMEEEEEDEYEEFEQYLSNRDRTEMRKAKKQQNKSNNDFAGF